MNWNREKIKSILPHREPFLFIDEIIEIDGIDRVVAVKNIKENESFLKGHFPGRPIMPGVLIIEAMAQASIILYSVCKPEIAETNPDYYLGTFIAKGKSGHNTGRAIDITLATGHGQEIWMGSVFDEFNENAHFTNYRKNGSMKYLGQKDDYWAFDKYKEGYFVTNEKLIIPLRTILRKLMVKEGFKPYDKEWWHFSLPSLPDKTYDDPIK